MDLPDCIGVAGVTLLLLAYFLSVLKKLSAETPLFTLMNFFGAFLAGLASLMIHYYPFVVLEGIWALVALYSFIKVIKNNYRIF